MPLKIRTTHLLAAISCASLLSLGLFSPVVSAGSNQATLVIDSGGHKAMINDLMFSPDGQQLYSVCDDKTIQRWDVSSGERTALWRGQQGVGDEGKLFAGALSPDGKWLAVGGYSPNDEVRLLNAHTGEVERLLKGHSNVILGLAFSADSRYLLSSGSDNTARIWELNSGDLLQTLEGHQDSIYGVAFSPDGKRVVTGSDDYTINIWNARNGQLLKTLEGHSDEVQAVAFTPDGRYLLSGGNDQNVLLWDGETGEFIKVLAEMDVNVAHLSISPDGKQVLTGKGCCDTDAPNHLFSIPSGKQLQNFTGHDNTVLATVFSPSAQNGINLVATGGGDNQEIHLWDSASGEIIQTLQGSGQAIWGVGFSQDGRQLAWGYQHNIKSGVPGLFARGTLQQSFSLPASASAADNSSLTLGKSIDNDQYWARAIEQVGSTAITTEDGDVHESLLIKQQDTEVHRITRDSTTGFDHSSLTLSPDGTIVISAGGTGMITSYDASTGEQLHEFVGHTSAVWAVAPSPDGRYLVSGGDDQTVRLWQITTGRLLLTIFPSNDGEWVAWTPEGYYTSSLKGDKLIGWHINRGEDKKADYYPASQFASQYFKPAVVAAYVTNGGDLQQAIASSNKQLPRRQQVSGESINLQDLLPPLVVVKQPLQSVMTTSNATIKLNAEARSVNGQGIEQFWVTVNGKTPEGERALKRIKQNSNAQRASLDLSIKLEPGENRIAVLAKNKHSQSEPEIIRVTYNAAVDNYAKPNLYLLAIGVSDYEDGDYNLDYADDDAAGIAKAFKAQQGNLYRKVHTKVLTNKDATRGNILDGLDWLLEETTQHDTAVVFVAGHGMKDERNNYYFIPHDGKAEKLKRSAVNWFDFQDALSGLPGTRLLLADTCHSGGITGKRRGSNQSDITDALRDLRTADGGIVVMAAATGNEVSVEHPDWGHGAFTKALIDGLGNYEADYNKDNRIDIKELDLYVTDKVKELTKGRQHPTTEIPTIVPNFPVGLR